MIRPFAAREIHLTDGTVLTNVVCHQVASFLIVGKDDQDSDPTWYSCSSVVKMVGVKQQEPKRPQMKAGPIYWI